MHEFIAWCGFLGAWLLVAGPVYQAALELRDEDFRRDELIDATANIRRSPPVSPWWWLLPPVHFWLQRRRSRTDRDAMMAALSDEQMRGLIDYLNKATGWLFVAAGATLIAVKETYELAELHEWPLLIFVLLVLVMALLSVLYTAGRMRRHRQLLGASDSSHDRLRAGN